MAGNGEGAGETDATSRASPGHDGLIAAAGPSHAGWGGRLADGGARIAYRAGFRLARLLWAVTRPDHRGALVAVTVGPAMLLLRQSYRPEWSMPGGGVRPGEAPEAAAIRELAEELGLCVRPGSLREVHTETGRWDNRRDTVTFFELPLAAPPTLRLDNREVVAAALLRPETIGPGEATPAVRAYLDWRTGRVQ